MGLILIFAAIFLTPVIAAIFFFIAASMLQEARPKRAKIVHYSLSILLIGTIGFTVLGRLIPLPGGSFEITAIGATGALGAIATLGAASLLVPKPDRSAAVGLIVFGFLFLGLSAYLAFKMLNVNLGL